MTAASTQPPSATAAVATAGESHAAVCEAPKPDEFDIVATYHRLLDEDADLTKPIAAIEALIGVLRHYPASTAMETYEVTGHQVQRLLNALPNPLPAEAGTSLFMDFLGLSMRQQPASATASTGALDSFDKIRQHLLDNSQVFVRRAKDARDLAAQRGCRLVRRGDIVMTAGGSRAVLALLGKAADRLRGGPCEPTSLETTSSETASSETASSETAPFTVLYVCDDRSRQEAAHAITVLRQRYRVPVIEIDAGMVAYALATFDVSFVLVGAEVVTHDGNVLSRMGTFQLATLAHTMRPSRPFYVLAETHKFVRKLIVCGMSNCLEQVRLHQSFPAEPPLPAPPTFFRRPATRPTTPTNPPIPYRDQVDVTPRTLVTNFITEHKIMSREGCFGVIKY